MTGTSVVDLHDPAVAADPHVVAVDRRTRWGNPFRVGETVTVRLGGGVELALTIADAEVAVAMFDAWVDTSDDPAAVWIRGHVAQLAGRRIGCWCAPGSPCHARSLARRADAAGQLPFPPPPAASSPSPDPAT